MGELFLFSAVVQTALPGEEETDTTIAKDRGKHDSRVDPQHTSDIVTAASFRT
jgi:hypothetical protein